MSDSSTNYPIAITLVVLGALSMALMGVFVKALGPQFNWSETLFFRFLLSFLFFLPFLIKDKTFTFKLKKPKWLIVRLVGGIGSMVLYFAVLHYINLANATLLVMSAPIYVPIFALIFLNVHTTWKAWCGIVVAVIGIGLVLHPNIHIIQWASIVGVISGILQGLSNLAQRKVFTFQTANQVLFYYYLVSIVFTACVLPFNWVTPNFHQGLELFGVAIFGCLFTTFYTVAFKYAPSRYLAPFSLTSIIFAGFFDWMIWSQLPSELSIIGAVVLLVGLLIVLLGKK